MEIWGKRENKPYENPGIKYFKERDENMQKPQGGCMFGTFEEQQKMLLWLQQNYPCKSSRR